MNKEDLILQKLESMETEIKSVRSEVKDVRSEMNDRIDKIDSKLEGVNADFQDIREASSEMKINQVKLAGDLHTLDVRVTGKLETLETKLDGFINQAREQKGDTNERWKIGGIIVSCGIAIVSLVLSVLTRMGQ